VKRRVAFLERDDGQTMAEYGVTLAVITPAIVLAISLLSDSVAATVARAAALLSP
jgi:Flp pilus assembly pilin Flp